MWSALLPEPKEAPTTSREKKMVARLSLFAIISSHPLWPPNLCPLGSKTKVLWSLVTTGCVGGKVADPHPKQFTTARFLTTSNAHPAASILAGADRRLPAASPILAWCTSV